MDLAIIYELQSITYPALLTGFFTYPIKKAAAIIFQKIQDILEKPTSVNPVRFVHYETSAFQDYLAVLQTMESM